MQLLCVPVSGGLLEVYLFASQQAIVDFMSTDGY